eukprot:1156641-Pelagomonas_calceolata.AAC.7
MHKPWSSNDSVKDNDGVNPFLIALNVCLSRWPPVRWVHLLSRNGPPAPHKLHLYLVSSLQIHALFGIAVQFAPESEGSKLRGRSSAVFVDFTKKYYVIT